MGRSATSRGPVAAPLAIEMQQVELAYGETRALAGLDLCVAAGTFFALLGPNGAGKTTTVGVLTTLLRPSAGRARVLGADTVEEAGAVRSQLGIVFQEPSLDLQLTAREQLDLHARLYHLQPRRVRRARVERVLELVELSSEADRPVKGFSGGMKRRLEIARGLVHQPRVLFLDEPTLGLDVRARQAIWDHLRALHAAGDTTIFLTTHSMEEAEKLCEEVAIVDRGRIVTQGSPPSLIADLGGDVLELRLRDPEAALRRVEGLEGVVRAEVSASSAASLGEHPGLRVAVANGPQRLPAVLEALREHAVSEVTLHRPSLQDVFLHHTGRDFASEEAEAGEPEGNGERSPVRGEAA